MKRCAYFLAAIAAALSWAACTPAEAEPVHRLTVTLATDSVRVTVYYGTNSTADSTRITVTSSTGASQTKTVIGSAKGALAFTFLAPAEGATASGQVTAVAYRMGVASAPSPAKSWSYARPITAPIPTPIDSVTVQQVAMALSEAHPLGPLAVVFTAFPDTCAGEWRDYYGVLLLAYTGPANPVCTDAWNRRDRPGQIGYDNAAAVALGNRWRAQWPAYMTWWQAQT